MAYQASLRFFNRLGSFYHSNNKFISDSEAELKSLLEALSSDYEAVTPNSYTFNSLYDKDNGTLAPTFLKTKYPDLLQGISEQGTFGIIYLHDALLDNPLEYVNEILCSESFVNLVQKFQTLLWFGSIQSSDALQVANSLNIRKFPFLGILWLKNSGTVELIYKQEGPLDAGSYNPQTIDNLLAKRYPTLINIRQQRQNQEMERLIRDQQDSRFEESLRRDQERDEQRNAEIEREHIQTENRRLEKEWLLWRKAQLKPKPVGDMTDKCNIAIRLNGDRLIRKFDSSLRIEEIYAYVELYRTDMLNSDETYQNGNEPPLGYEHNFNFKLMSLVPRKELDLNTIIRDESAIYPSGNVVVELL